MTADDALVDPAPTARLRSSTATSSPARASCSAMLQPTTPAPISTASADVGSPAGSVTCSPLVFPAQPSGRFQVPPSLIAQTAPQSRRHRAPPARSASRSALRALLGTAL